MQVTVLASISLSTDHSGCYAIYLVCSTIKIRLTEALFVSASQYFNNSLVSLAISLLDLLNFLNVPNIT